MRTSERTRASSSAWSNGLVTKSSAPASSAATFCCSPLAVTITTGRYAVRGLGPDPPAHLVAVHPRHHDVEQHQVDGCAARQALERLLARARRARTV